MASGLSNGQGREESALRASETSREAPILWHPTTDCIDSANLTSFAKQNGFASRPCYERLHRWSVSCPDEFWNAVWDFADIIGERGQASLVRTTESSMLGTKWYPDGKLNFTENLLRGDDESLAVIEANEDGIRRRVSMGELRLLVGHAQTGLRNLGVVSGDRVAGILPNTLDAVVALLATASLGAIWSSCSPDFGAAGIIDRIGQINPKVLIAAPSYRYNGKPFEISDRLRSVLDSMTSVQHLILLADSSSTIGYSISSVFTWDEFMASQASEPTYERFPFNHPLYVLYTSGTTGLPKGIVHTAGGTLLQHCKEHQLHCDIKRGDVMSWYTNTAWMMYHWLISGLASGAALLLYDGAATVARGTGQDLGILWKNAQEAGVTHFGTSPKYLSALMSAKYEVGRNHDLSKLRSVLSAGAPVSAEHYEWVYRAIKKDMIFASVSGGTEIIGNFVMGSPVHPVRRGEITCKALGMAVDVLDDRGASIIGRKGHLVCTEPFPSAPLTFWGENGDDRYRSTYFEERPDIWSHGDLAEQTINNTVVIYGRTDTTLNPGGVRIGTAEIYRVVESITEVQDSVVFGFTNAGDEEIILCVVLPEGAALTPDLTRQIRAAIREKASPRHVPHRICQVSAVPYTLSGKKVEGAARAVAAGARVKNIGSISNPECLAEFGSLMTRAAT